MGQTNLFLRSDNFGTNAQTLQKLTARRKFIQQRDSCKAKCVPEDWIDFVSLTQIRSGNRLVYFNPYQYQIEISAIIDRFQFTLAVKGRQLGLSQLVVSKFLHKACLNPAYVALVLSKTGDDTYKLARRVREMISSIGDLIETENDNLQTIKIKNGGQLLFKTSKPDATRSIDSVSDVLIDEAAFIFDVETMYSAVLPTIEMVGEDARVIILSTPNTQSDWYFQQLMGDNPEGLNPLEICKEIREGRKPPFFFYEDLAGWAKVFIHWRAHPVYNKIPNYIEKLARTKKLPLARIRQEYDLSFEDNVESVFPPSLIRQTCCVGELAKVAEEDTLYLMGIDTAGQGDDFTVCTVFKKDKKLDEFFLVDYYRKKSGTISEHLFRICRLIDTYRPYNIAIEVNAGGQNYYELLTQTYPSQRITAIRTTQNNKIANIEKLLFLFQIESIFLPDKEEFINEFLAFQRQGNKLEAMQGRHDDIVMSCAFAASIFPIWDKPSLGNIKKFNIWDKEHGTTNKAKSTATT